MVVYRSECPYCNQPTKFVDCSAQKKIMIDLLRFKCKYTFCKESFTDVKNKSDLLRHEASCKFQRNMG